MLSDEEKQKLEQEFQYALDNIVSKIKGETATAIVYSEQSMILLFRKLMFRIEKQSKEIEELKEKNKNLNWYFENQKDNFVHKDKIKAKIEELNNKLKNADEIEAVFIIKQQQVLESLLEKE